MAYTIQKNQNGENDLVISGWENGIANSALLGLENITNVDIWTRPGFAQPGFSWSNSSLIGITPGVFGVVNWIVYNPVEGVLYCVTNVGTVDVDANGQGAVWTTLPGHGTSGQHGNGLCVWISRNNPNKSFLFSARDTSMDVYDAVAGVWHNDFVALNQADIHPMFVGTDGRLYIGNHAGIMSFQEADGVTFDPTNSATYSINNPALDLPGGYFVNAITQLGQNLQIGTIFQSAGNSPANIADIFPWDKESDSYAYPISLQTNGINQMTVLNNLMYIQAGYVSNISASNGSTTQIVVQDLPIQGTGHPGGIGVIDGRTVIFAVDGAGIYGLRDGKYVTLQSHVVAGTPDNLHMNAVCVTPLNANSLCYAVDNTIVQVDGQSRFSDYSAQIDTDLVPVATYLYKRSFSEVEFKLGSLLPDGAGVKISYRTSQDATFTLIGQWENNGSPTPPAINVGAVMSYVAPANIDSAEYLQFRIQIRNGFSSNSTLYLREIRVR